VVDRVFIEGLILFDIRDAKEVACSNLVIFKENNRTADNSGVILFFTKQLAKFGKIIRGTDRLSDHKLHHCHDENDRENGDLHSFG
jgi:hypothetical protein